MYFEGYEIIDSPEGGECGPVLIRNQYGLGTVVFYDGDGQITNAMPGDAPAGGGTWYARPTRSGVDYVASFYSLGYAKKIYRKLAAEWI